MSKTSVFCIAQSHSAAEQIVESLQSSGFNASEISVLLPDTEGKHDIGMVKATKAPEGATTGATAGGVTGGVLGLLAGIGALAIPGVGPFIAAGAIAGAAIPGAALTGAAIGAAAGGLTGLLTDHGVDENDAAYYEERVNNGGVFVSVDTNNAGIDARTARDILFNAGGHSSSRARTGATI